MHNNYTETFINGLIAKAQQTTPQAKQQARKCLLDYLGARIGGLRYLREQHPEMIEALSRGSAQDKTLLNGFAAHLLELDDGHRLSAISPSFPEKATGWMASGRSIQNFFI